MAHEGKIVRSWIGRTGECVRVGFQSGQQRAAEFKTDLVEEVESRD